MTGFQIRKKGLLVRELDGEVLVLDTESDRIHQLNRSASFIWRELSAGATPEQIAKDLAMEFGINETIARRDVTESLSEFCALSLLVRRDESDSKNTPEILEE